MADYVEKVHATLTADGNGTAYGYVSTGDGEAGDIIFQGEGTFGSGTVTLQYFANDGTWRDVVGAIFTEDFAKSVRIPINTDIRVSLSGATTPSIYVQLSVRGRARLRVV